MTTLHHHHYQEYIEYILMERINLSWTKGTRPVPPFQSLYFADQIFVTAANATLPNSCHDSANAFRGNDGVGCEKIYITGKILHHRPCHRCRQISTLVICKFNQSEGTHFRCQNSSCLGTKKNIKRLANILQGCVMYKENMVDL